MNSHNVICVTSNSTLLTILRSSLEQNFRLEFFRTASTTLAKFKTSLSRLIIIDINLSDMHGLDLARHITSQVDIPIIFISETPVQNIYEYFNAGGVDIIVPPFHPLVIASRIGAQIEKLRVKYLKENYKSAIHILGKLGHYGDDATSLHIWRMGAYSKLLAQAIGWSKFQAELLELAAAMHDIGKLSISKDIMNKPGKLTDDEFEIMKIHPVIGHNILSISKAPVFTLAAEVALNHHEKWNGTGYPNGLKGLDIPESARIVAVADIFDALTMKRPYKEPWPVEKAVEHLQSLSDNHLQGFMVSKFISILPEILKEKNRWDTKENSMVFDIT